MTAQGIYKITENFEKEVAKYTGAPFCVALDNGSNALFLALKYINIEGLEIEIPSHTYPSVPCEIIHAGGAPKFVKSSKYLKGAYQLKPTPVWDSALRFTHNMYIPGAYMCLSFTGPYKHLKLSKGGGILTDNKKAYQWFKKARFSGRREKSYHEDDLDTLGWNFYMMPEIAARGLLFMKQFYTVEANPRPLPQKDKEVPYPDLSKFEIYTGGK
ncbi:MAG: DegT/DnrJ/EryC1/StrS family aminotransferase [Candidatus Omnitrophota bacterium]